MSLSKIALEKCEICYSGSGIYTCPRCNRRYCSSDCYKSRSHELCSESFYREWVESTLQEKALDQSERSKMLDILKKCKDDVDSCEEHSIEERFANINLDDADENVIWQNLTEEEQVQVKEIIGDEQNLETIIPLKQPWWTIVMLNLVTEIDSETPDKNDDVSPRPHFPLNVKPLSSLTSKKPSECIQYNLVSVIYSYAFLFRFYNCDLRDFLEDVVDGLLILTPVLTEGRNYFSLEESVQDCVRLISNSEFKVPLDFIKSISNDVSSILHGPNNAKPGSFVLCALNDIKMLIYELKYFQEQQKIEQKVKSILKLATLKIEYFMSWSLDNETSLADIASDLLLLMLPELFANSESNKFESETFEHEKQKPLIEELD